MGEGKEEKKKKMCCWDFSLCHMLILNLPTHRHPPHTAPLSLWEHLPTDHTHQEAIKANLVITATHAQITSALSSTLPHFPPPHAILTLVHFSNTRMRSVRIVDSPPRKDPTTVEVSRLCPCRWPLPFPDIGLLKW